MSNKSFDHGLTSHLQYYFSVIQGILVPLVYQPLAASPDIVTIFTLCLAINLSTHPFELRNTDGISTSSFLATPQ